MRLLPVSRLLGGLALAAAAVLLAAPSTMAQDPEWGYEGPAGPPHWHMLSPAFAACGAGLLQSPIDLGDARTAPAPAIVTDYRRSPVTLERTAETVDVVSERSQRLRVGAKEYSLVQLHFHGPSEHRVGGRRAPLELHFVHQAAGGERAVLGVLVRPGRRNATAASIVAALPARAGQERRAGREVDLTGLLPRNRRAYRYDGSLTTPPCSEGIRWMVLSGTVALSRPQIAALRRVAEGNARPVQPANGRVPVLG
jgi:carbonic anhydrase